VVEVSCGDVQKVCHIINENKKDISKEILKVIKKGSDISKCKCAKCDATPQEKSIWRYKNLCLDCADNMSIDELWNWHLKYSGGM
jgi:hypothetical protein